MNAPAVPLSCGRVSVATGSAEKFVCATLGILQSPSSYLLQVCQSRLFHTAERLRRGRQVERRVEEPLPVQPHSQVVWRRCIVEDVGVVTPVNVHVGAVE